MKRATLRRELAALMWDTDGQPEGVQSYQRAADLALVALERLGMEIVPARPRKPAPRFLPRSKSKARR
jgi:hypothetical protein